MSHLSSKRSSIPTNTITRHIKKVDINAIFGHAILFQNIGNTGLNLSIVCHIDSSERIDATQCSRCIRATEYHGGFVGDAYSCTYTVYMILIYEYMFSVQLQQQSNNQRAYTNTHQRMIQAFQWIWPRVPIAPSKCLPYPRPDRHLCLE